MLPKFYIDDIIITALREDINYIDTATDLLIDAEAVSEAYFIAKDSGVLCGIDAACRVFEMLDGEINIEKHFKDGDRINKGDIIAEFRGRTAALLKGERTALNLIQHMSGISTYTNKCVGLVSGTDAKITDTRKTLPGLRALQKYAVRTGGGFNHRFNLSDAAMLKDNHIDAYGGITAAAEALRAKIGHMVKTEVEVRNFNELNEALEAGVQVIMLDNMNPEQMKKAVEITAGKALLEASGNITAENIRAVAESGVDIISLGALTHSVVAFDISMKWKTGADILA